MCAPAGGKGCFYRNGEGGNCAGSGLGERDVHQQWGASSTSSPATKGPEHWWQYTTGGQFRTRDMMLDFVERLEDSSCTGICFTVDNMLVSHRERSVHNGLVRTWCNLGGIPRDEDGNLIYKENDRTWVTDEYPSRATPTPTWETVKQLRESD